MSSFWELYFRPMRVLVLSVSKVGPPTCDIGDSELEVSELLCLPWKGSIHISDLQHHQHQLRHLHHLPHHEVSCMYVNFSLSPQFVYNVICPGVGLSVVNLSAIPAKMVRCHSPIGF